MDAARGAGAPIKVRYSANLCGSIEQALKALQGYGLMALELIQNADDAKATTLIFDVRDTKLTVFNDAAFSSCGFEDSACPWEFEGDPEGVRRPCNFHAIATMASRSKVFAADQIGRFGIGFVSVYQLTDTPIIRSAGIQLSLNPLTGEGSAIRILPDEGTEFELAFAAQSSAIRDALNASTTPADVETRLIEEITKVLDTSLLFLRHLTKVELHRSGRPVLQVVLNREPNALEIAFEPTRRKTRWTMLSRSAEDIVAQLGLASKYPELTKLGRSPIVSVAIPDKSEDIDGLLFAYLPTQQPTEMPLHINGDFFPHASRQHIVLQGEGHERYWNECLLAGAAAALADNFGLLKEVLGAKHLWELLGAAFKLKDPGPFSAFWKRLEPIARLSESGLAQSGHWKMPKAIKMPPEALDETQRTALSRIGLELLDPSLRPHWTVLSAVGLTELRVVDVASALGAVDAAAIKDESHRLEDLWSAIALLLEASERRPDHQTGLKALSSAVFLTDFDETLVAPANVWRLPVSVNREALHRVVPDCPVVSERLSAFPGLLGIIDLYELEDFATDLASVITTPEDAERIIGREEGDVKEFYNLLTGFPVDDRSAAAASDLSATPLLKTQRRFVEPSRAMLPGGFTDPIGHFEVLDIGLMSDAMQSFAQHVLGVTVLSFEEYIREHLEDILKGDLSREQYRDLLGEIANYKYRLDDEGVLDLLAERSFVRTRAGTFERPCDCYIWSSGLEAILGADQQWWVDESWMPEGAGGSRLRDLLESKLGMPTRVSARHIVDRIEALPDELELEELGRAVNTILKHVVEQWSRLTEDDRDVLGELSDVEFLPALVDDHPSEFVHSPSGVYRAVRAAGFSSQVPVVNIPTLRLASATVNELLDLWEMPTEPSTDVIVRHLEHCMETNSAPSDVTYTLLNERVEREDGLSSVDRLRDRAFIYFDEEFRAAEELFWLPPPFGRFWHAASRRMQTRQPLYRRLGVRDAPVPIDYTRLMLEIARKPSWDQVDLDIHHECLRRTADAVDRDEPGVGDAIDLLEDEECLFNIDGRPVWPADALWVDSDLLVEPFGTDLNERLIQPPEVEKSAAGRFFRKLGVQPVTEAIHLRLAEAPRGVDAIEATELLGERAPLLLWLAPNPAAHAALRRILATIRVSLTSSLLIQAVIEEFDPPIKSPATAADAFFDEIEATLYVRGSKMSPNEWTAAFRALFSQLEAYSGSADLKPLVTTASFLMMFSTLEEAAGNLRSGGYLPPLERDEDFGWAEQIDGARDDDDEEDPLEAEGSDGPDIPPGPKKVEAESDRRDDEEDDLHDDSSTDEQPEGTGIHDSFESEGDDDEGDAYKSKAGSGALAAGSSPGASNGSGTERGGKTGGDRSGSKQRRGETTTERHARRSRMLTYVEREGSDRKDDADNGRESADLSDLIDANAIKAVLKYEQSHGRAPVEQPHNNPGYDVLSTAPDGSRRLIEVKGLRSDWTECGTKLSHIQYKLAEENPTEFWLYVVENSPDMQRQTVSAIPDPFNMVREYWFDHNWRDAREESANARELNVRVGATVRHAVWKEGEILEVTKRGYATQVKVRFAEGVKLIPFNNLLEVLD